MSWITVRVTPTRGREAILALLFNEGASCVQEDSHSLVTGFAGADAIPALTRKIHQLDPDAAIVSGKADTSYDLHGSVAAQIVGDLIVAPPWFASAHPPARTIIIEPAGGFGTGEHPTTRGVLRLMQGVVRPGDFVADLGAGSAVLSIAAAKLGASRVAAIELDDDSIPNAEGNVAANGVEEIVEVIHGDASSLLPLLAPVDLILANIISGFLLELLPVMRASLAQRGRAILSGTLHEERARMLESFAAGLWQLEREETEDEWWTVLIVPR